jgi:hypothetical protein
MKYLCFVTILIGLFALINGLPHRDYGYGRQPTVVIVKQPIIPRPRPQVIVVNQRPLGRQLYGPYH